MKIWYFEADPEMGWTKAGYTVDGKRYTSLVWEQAGQLYVITGKAITGDLRRHNFTPAQAAAFEEFCKGSSWSVEYMEGVA